MNWSTVLPLYDRENRVCGTLLFEGQQSNDKLAATFTQMRDLAVSGGRALSTSLVWQRRRTLRVARVLMRWRDALLATSRRQLAVKYGLPAFLVIALLAFPFPYRIRGDATLRPEKVHSVSALTTGRLMEVNVREGDRVKKDQVLCVLDSTDLQLQLRQVEQEHERALTKASLALRQDRNESMSQLARLEADQASTMADKLRRDIDLTIVRAPFDGVLVGPQDLTQRRGQVIRTGEVVAEIVDPTNWEVKVSVREQDVPTLMAALGQMRASGSARGIPGELALTAHPDHIFNLVLTDSAAFAHRLDTSGGKYNFSAIMPLADGAANAARLGEQAELKSGYGGRVRFSCGRRPFASILFGDFVRFMKLTFF
jgi:biotin carboxyl carrier protein